MLPEENEEPPIDSVPDEVIKKVFDLLPLSDKKNCRLISPRWRRILDYSETFKFRPIIDDSKTAEYLLSYSDYPRKVDSVLVRDLGPDEFTTMIYSEDTSKFPQIQSVTIGPNNSELNILKFLKNGCGHPKHLKIDKWSLVEVGIDAMAQSLPEIRWINLVELELYVIWKFSTSELKRSETHSAMIGNFLKFSTFPVLTKLHLEFDSDTGNSVLTDWFPNKFMGIFPEFYGFIDRHTDKLRSLDLILLTSRCVTFDKNQVRQKLISTEVQESINRNLKLDFLSIRFTGIIGGMVLEPVLNLASSKLTTVKWLWNESFDVDYRLTMQSIDHDRLLQNLIVLNNKTLVDVNILVDSTFNFDGLENYTSLKKLSLEAVGMTTNREICIPSLRFLIIRIHVPNFDLCPWIVRSFKNLEILKLASTLSFRYVNISKLEKYLTLPKLRELSYFAHSFNLDLDQNQVQLFCHLIPGLSYTCDETGNHWRQLWTLTRELPSIS